MRRRTTRRERTMQVCGKTGIRYWRRSGVPPGAAAKQIENEMTPFVNSRLSNVPNEDADLIEPFENPARKPRRCEIAHSHLGRDGLSFANAPRFCDFES